ncbi:unnamed protein product [Rotaria sp. Silwood2]|nr:unnamed protein product [Rotaria sp. Silwood2]CAF2636540.1 unnamed protein product [Rotaria sp. Silwood2]CAF3053729.1 unnamed protein product [Rotaria sp. Silwood2]CAF3120724.1 unnamed protein product [Rotaria sp. Silwood2]CAF3974318.1 unnamed protein product [Rotaria sp. Silwood2]
MIFRSIFAFTLIVTVFVPRLNAINPSYLQGDYDKELAAPNIVGFDYQSLPIVIKQDDDGEEITDDNILKRSIFRNFHLSPLWLSRRTRAYRFYGKPLWISRTGR